jgi:hypothetical protein
VQPGVADVPGHPRDVEQEHLADHHAHPGLVVGVEDGAPLLVDGLHLLLVPDVAVVVLVDAELLAHRRVVGQVGAHVQRVGDVDPEAVDAPVEPEPQDAQELLMDLPVGPVEVGLRAVEQVQVPLPGGLVPGPRGPAEHALQLFGGPSPTPSRNQ